VGAGLGVGVGVGAGAAVESAPPQAFKKTLAHRNKAERRLPEIELFMEVECLRARRNTGAL